MSVHDRVRTHFAAVNEERATPYTRAVGEYARQRGDLIGIGSTPQQAAGYLRPRISRLQSDPDLAALLSLANDEEWSVLREDPMTAQRIDEFLQSQQESE